MSWIDEFDLHDKTGYLVARLFHAMAQEFGRGLAKHGASPPHWPVLITLYQKKAKTPGELARYIGVDAGGLTRLLDRLESSGLVVRKPGSDRRSITVELTKAGRGLTPKLGMIAKQVNDKFMDGLSDTEIRRFKSTVRKMLQSGGAESIKLRDYDHA